MAGMKRIEYIPSKIDTVLENVFDEVLLREPQRVLWLCANRRLVRERIARFAAYLARKGLTASMLPVFKTLKDFAIEHYELAYPSFRYLDEIGTVWMLEEINQIIGSQQSKQPASDFLGLVMALIQEFKGYLGVNYEQVKERVLQALNHWLESYTPALDAGIQERVRERLTNVLYIYEIYEKIKEKRGLFDEFDAYYPGKFLPLDRYKFLVLDSFQDFFPAQQEYLQRLKELFPEVVELEPVIKMPDEGEVLLEGVSGKLILATTRYRTFMEEAREVVSQIRGLIDSGVEPESILVIVPELSKVASIYKTLFEEAGIETNVSQGNLLGTTPFGGFLKALSEFLVDSSPPSTLFNLISSFAVSEAFSEDSRLIRAFRRTNRAELLYHEGYVESLKQKLAEEGLFYISRLLELASEMKKAASMEEAFYFLEEILFSLLEEARKTGNDAQSLEDIISFLFAYKQSSIYLSEKDREFNPRRFKVLLNGVLSQPSKRYQGDVAKSVQLTGVLESRGQAADFVFLVGFVDSAFPGRPMKTYLLPDRVKELLGLPTSDQYLLRQKKDFYRLLAAARYGVFISFYEQEKNEVLRESRFVTELRFLKEKGLLKNIFEISPNDYKKVKIASKSSVKETSKIEGEDRRDRENEEQPDLKTIRVNITDLLKIYDNCPLKLYLGVHGTRTVEYPSIKFENRQIGSLLHEAISKFLNDAALSPKLMSSASIINWVDKWWEELCLKTSTGPLTILEFYGEERIKKILRESLENAVELLVGTSHFQNEVKLEKVTEYQGAERVRFELEGRADVVAYMNDELPLMVIDFKFKDKLDKTSLKKDAFQLFLYEFLLSETPVIENFEPLLEHYLIETLFLKDEVAVRKIDPPLDLVVEFREKFISALDILAKDNPPKSEKCSDSNNCFYRNYCFKSR
jgi:hypothetical protein